MEFVYVNKTGNNMNGIGLLSLTLLLLRKKRTHVGSLATLNPTGLQSPARTMETALKYLTGDKAGNINAEIFTNGDGNVILSEKIQQATGLPETITTKKDILTALRALRTLEEQFIWFRPYEYNFYQTTRKQVMHDIQTGYIDYINNNGAKTDFDGYIYALAYIANGGKYIWYDQKNRRGVKSEILSTGSDGKTDRKAQAKILNDKKGISPEEQAEQITAYDSDEYYVKNGILTAIMEVQTPQDAYRKLVQIIKENTDPFYSDKIPDYDAPF